MKKTFLSLAVALLMAPAFAETEANGIESEGSGFLTSALNEALESAMAPQATSSEVKAKPDAPVQYGRTVTGFVSAPKFGGYVISRYQYNDQDGKKGGPGFNQRLVRFYIDGTILKDFAYRIQLQTNNDAFHLKDFFVEWRKYKFAMIKVGQFKRAFGFENPMNPWDISTGDYSLMTKYLTGHNDYLGADTKGSANGGRDLGIQVQGDFLPVGNDNHNLIHYQVMVSNGTGINCNDTDGKKDITGTLQFQPIKGLYVGAFGWKGTFKGSDAQIHDRNRYAFGAKYDSKGWSARAEYAHGQSGYGNGNADAWYVVGGMPINDWFKVSAQYQTARIGKSWENAQVIYSLIPEFQLHKNLKMQVQYNFNDNRYGADKHYNELWAEFYFRF